MSEDDVPALAAVTAGEACERISHDLATGVSRLVQARGLMVEVHPEPERALSDGYQSLYPDQFDALMGQVSAIAAVLGRTVANPLPISG